MCAPSRAFARLARLTRLSKNVRAFCAPLARLWKKCTRLLRAFGKNCAPLEKICAPFARILKKIARFCKKFARLLGAFEENMRAFSALFYDMSTHFALLRKKFAWLLRAFVYVSFFYPSLRKIYSAICKNFFAFLEFLNCNQHFSKNISITVDIWRWHACILHSGE